MKFFDVWRFSRVFSSTTNARLWIVPSSRLVEELEELQFLAIRSLQDSKFTHLKWPQLSRLYELSNQVLTKVVQVVILQIPWPNTEIGRFNHYIETTEECPPNINTRNPPRRAHGKKWNSQFRMKSHEIPMLDDCNLLIAPFSKQTTHGWVEKNAHRCPMTWAFDCFCASPSPG